MGLERLDEIDMLKGFLILLVVLGHSEFQYFEYIYWFHMPAFFMISGFLYNKPKVEKLKLFSLRKSLSFLIPYTVFFVLISIASNVLGYLRVDINFILKALFGGKLLVGEFGVFWFITCLLFTTLFYSFAVIYIKNKYFFYIFLMICYLLAQTEYYFIYKENLNIFVPFNIDSSLIGVIYFHIGNLIRKNYPKFTGIILNNKTLVLFSMIPTMIILYIVFGNFEFDMKYQFYGGYFLAILIPTLITLFVFSISIILNSIKFYFNDILVLIGKSSLLIMYIHLFIKKVLVECHTYNTLLLLTLSIIIPVLLLNVFSKNKITSLLFLGDISKVNFKRE